MDVKEQKKKTTNTVIVITFKILIHINYDFVAWKKKFKRKSFTARYKLLNYSYAKRGKFKHF